MQRDRPDLLKMPDGGQAEKLEGCTSGAKARTEKKGCIAALKALRHPNALSHAKGLRHPNASFSANCLAAEWTGVLESFIR